MFLKLQAYFDTRLVRRRSLIVFDEVQHCPRVRQLVKYLVADGRYDYIEIGFHVDFASKKAKILLPSEEESFVLYPMDFEVFLAVQDATALAQTIRECYTAGKPLAAARHAKAMNFFGSTYWWAVCRKSSVPSWKLGTSMPLKQCKTICSRAMTGNYRPCQISCKRKCAPSCLRFQCSYPSL